MIIVYRAIYLISSNKQPMYIYSSSSERCGWFQVDGVSTRAPPLTHYPLYTPPYTRRRLLFIYGGWMHGRLSCHLRICYFCFARKNAYFIFNHCFIIPYRVIYISVLIYLFVVFRFLCCIGCFETVTRLAGKRTRWSLWTGCGTGEWRLQISVLTNSPR